MLSRRGRIGGYRSASAWPGWTDEVRSCIGPIDEPADADRERADREMGRDDHADHVLPDELLDELAREREAADLLERGLLL